MGLKHNQKITLISICILIGSFAYIFFLKASPQFPQDQPFLKQINPIPVDSPTEKNVTIALVDTGVDLNHRLLKKYLVQGQNIIDTQTEPQDDNGHGTRAAGVIASIIKSSGVNDSIKIMPIKALNNVGLSQPEILAKAIRVAVDQKVQVISLSLGIPYDSYFIKDAVNYAKQNKVLIVAASGNDGGETLYPALYPSVLAVGGINENDTDIAPSNIGSLDIVAPLSVQIFNLNGGYTQTTGTSMSSATVTAAAALLLLKNPSLEPYDIINALRESASQKGERWSEKYGFGMLNIGRLLETNYIPHDINEPNNSKNNAAIIPDNKTILALLTRNDTDWYYTDLKYSGSIILDINTMQNNSSDIRITIYEKENKYHEVFSNNISLQISTSVGRTYFKLSSLSNESIEYTITLKKVIYSDLQEPNNSKNEAFLITDLNKKYIGTFDNNDVDCYVINKPLKELDVKVKPYTNKIDPIIQIYSPINAQSNESIDLHGFGVEESWNISDSSGDYCFCISNNHNNPAYGEYEISFIGK
ncbi:S8 family peptidase [Paenibacillus xylaniclasticus]|uniref:S8 family peptidase n=1 Tax=Paenibacillus xylaniclasticus TaxID=588083 RepID=UPI0013DEA8F4|nr:MULTISPECIES: S8 family serine peptidase [Paenibacillus]GFN33975.1 hypothetical protein PCURB6_42350 [Paenibacillus curdlanolyticus]